jgi:hypothetical protein
MRLTPETADKIAVRAGMDPIATRKLLDGMASRRRIRAQHDQGQCTFRLVPRVYGVLGIGLPLRDVELARLAEQYYRETRGVSLEHPPPSVRVISIRGCL